MPKLLSSKSSLLALCGVLALLASGCSVRAKKERALKQANVYFTSGQYDAAEIGYLNVLRMDKANPEAIGRLGIIYFDQGRMGKALPFLLAGRRLEPQNLEVRLEFGLYLIAFTKFDEAKEEALYILDHDPSNADAPLLLAETTLHSKDFEAARKRLKELPPPIPDSAPVQVALGTIEFRLHHFDTAESLFKHALEADPKSSAAYTALGALYWAKNQIPEAGAAFAKAVEFSNSRSTKRLQYAQFMVQTGDREGGRRLLEEIAKATPDFLPASLYLAEMDEQDKRYEEGAKAVGVVLARDPNYPDAMLLSGRLWLERGMPDKSAEVLEYAKGVFPSYSQIYLELARAYLAQGATDKAAANLSQAIEQDPEFVEAILALVNIDTNRGDWVAVVNLLNPLLEKHPELLQARYYLANAYIQHNEPVAAIGVLRQIAAATPKDPHPLILTGMILLQQNDPSDARALFNAALSLNPDSTEALEQLVGLDIQERQLENAQKLIEGRLAANPKRPEFHLLKARIFLGQNEFAAAEAELKQTISLQPELPAPYFLLGEIYITNKEDEKALSDLRQVVAKNPKAIDALMLIATIEERQKKYGDARDTYEKMLAVDGNFAPALNNLAYLYTDKLNDLNKAFEMAQRARKLLPNEPNIADTLGWVLYKRQQYTWGLSLLQESASALQSQPVPQYHLGMLQYMLGDETGARASLERALKAGTDFDGIDLLKDRLAILEINIDTAGPADRALLEKAAAAHPDDPMVLSRLVAIYERDHDIDKAIAACEAALRLFPKDDSAMRLLAWLYSDKGQVAKGFELAKTAHNLAPNDSRVSEILGRLAFASRDYHWSLSLLREAAADRPNDPDAQYDLARALYSAGSVKDSEDAAQRALDLKAPFIRRAEAASFLELVSLGDDPAKAANTLDRLNELATKEPDNVPALMAKGEADEDKGNWVAAIQGYEAVLSHFPDFRPAERRLILLYSKNPPIGTKGVELAIRVREAFPKDPEVAKACGIVNYNHGDYRQAENLLTIGANQLPDDAEAVYYLGMAQYHLKEKVSKTTLEHALSLDLSNQLATEVKRVLAELRQ